MKNKALEISLFIVVVSAVFTGCVDKKSLELNRQEVVLNDGGSTTEDGRQIVVIDENSTKIAERKIKHSAVDRDPAVQNNQDGSQTTTTFDGYGNQTDSRCFRNNASLKCVVVETSFDGKIEVTAYGKSGEIKKIGADKIKNILDAPVNEIVDTAEFSADFIKADISKLMPSKKSEANIAPPPNSELSDFSKQAQPSQAETSQNIQSVSESEPIETEDREK